MSKNKQIILRVQSSEGTKRIEILPSASLRDLYESIHDAFKLDHYNFAVYGERGHKKEISSSRSQTVEDFNLKHGDMLYMKPVPAGSSSVIVDAFPPQPSTSSSNSSISSFAKPAADKKELKEDEVDRILEKRSGRIEQERDPLMCRHPSNQKCPHCGPIDPWDEKYLEKKNIKHLSFHSYLRKLSSGASSTKRVALEEFDYSVKKNCPGNHAPYPLGICTKCQPSAVTLNRQKFRHVDHIMFENGELVDRFLNYWRTTDHQRAGILYGAYEPIEDDRVPLGIRARVAAIYEPPQESTRNSIKLLPDERAAEIDDLASKLGLQQVGWIFTDLITDDATKGTVKHIRGAETHFLSAQECIMAAHLQNQHPNVCKHSSSGTFGSKFVTVCLTGNKDKQIYPEGYAVSNQAMGLVRSNILIPTKDAPELGYIRESIDKKLFVPDVFYRMKDQYNNEVQRQARPLPVEYLLVDVPASMPNEPMYTFTARPGNKDMFPVENRYIDGHLQDFNALSAYISKWKPNEFLEAVSDFHLLLYLNFMDMLPMKSAMGPLLEAVRTKNYAAAVQWKEQEVWSTLETLITASSSASGGMGNYPDTNARPAAAADWTCNHCTFINRGDLTSCEICNLPRN